MNFYPSNKTRFRDVVLKGSGQLFASKYSTVLPTELERERRVIERKQNGGDINDILAPEP